MKIPDSHHFMSRGRILGRNWDKSPSFPPCYSQLPQLTEFTLPRPPLSESGLKIGLHCKQCIYVNLKSKNSQDYAQKPQ